MCQYFKDNSRSLRLPVAYPHGLGSDGEAFWNLASSNPRAAHVASSTFCELVPVRWQAQFLTPTTETTPNDGVRPTIRLSWMGGRARMAE